MRTGRLSVVDSAVEDLYVWLREIDDEMGWDDRHYGLQALRGVLHALRDRLLIDQMAKLSAQLPLLVRGLFFENWDPSKAPVPDRTAKEFVDRVRDAFTGYGEQLEVEEAVPVVLEVLGRHISEGEVAKVKAALPKHIRELWP